MHNFGGVISQAIRSWARARHNALNDPGRPINDVSARLATSKLLDTTTPAMLYGVIADSSAPANCYRVFLERYNAVRGCIYTGGNAQTFAGAKTLATLPPGTGVIVLDHPAFDSGLIICTVPRISTSSTNHMPDMICPAARQRADQAHFEPLRLGGLGVVDAGFGRPLDATTVGEAGWITETGLRIFIDAYLLQMSVDETCGIFASYWDRFLRLAAYNFEFFTAGAYREAFNDCGEYCDEQGATPYPWEQLGLLTPGNAGRNVPAEQWQITDKSLQPREPAQDGAEPYARLRRIFGYPATGEALFITAPPAGTHNTLSTPTAGAGLLAEHRLLNGQYLLASATGFMLTKQLHIPSVKRVKRATDTTGDNPENYKFAGQYGSGTAHIAQSQPDADSGNPDPAGNLLDYHAHLYNQLAINGFARHTEDWAVDENARQDNFVPDYGRLRANYTTPGPEPVKIKVDHVFGEQDYYPGRAGIYTTPDGNLGLFNAHGAAIQLVGDRIVVTAAADIEIMPGRDCRIWSGRDSHIRSKRAIDISATDGAVRVKAQTQFSVLGGNEDTGGDSGAGGILLESRSRRAYDVLQKTGDAATMSGIVLKAAGTIATIAQNTLVQTQGDLLLESQQGAVSVQAAALNAYVSSGCSLFFVGGSGGAVRAATRFQESGAAISGTVATSGGLLVDQGIITGGNILVTQGHIATEQAAKMSMPLVGGLKDQALTDASAAITSANSQSKAAAKQGSEAKSQIDSRFHAANKPGDAETQKHLQFSFRTSDEYGTDGFYVVEPYWHQLARRSGQALTEWKERPVKVESGNDSYPFPGYDGFSDGAELFRQCDSTLVEISASGIVVSDPSTERTQYAPTTQVSLNALKVTG